MSSLAAARADGYYIDPAAYDPSKGRGGANAIAGSHPLGERAKKLKSEGILVIRFELPHDGWCLKCGEHIASGVRFNAEKKAVGAYHSTTIWAFGMTCPSCSNAFEIRTDPANADYAYAAGIRRKVTDFDASSAGLAALAGPTPGQRAALEKHGPGADPLYRLEHAADDKRRAASVAERLAALQSMRDSRYADDYASNQALRAAARGERASHASALAEGAAIGLPGIPLLPATDADAAEAALVMTAARVERVAERSAGSASATGAAAVRLSGGSASGLRLSSSAASSICDSTRDGRARHGSASTSAGSVRDSPGGVRGLGSDRPLLHHAGPYEPVRFVRATGQVFSPSETSSAAESAYLPAGAAVNASVPGTSGHSAANHPAARDLHPADAGASSSGSRAMVTLRDGASTLASAAGSDTSLVKAEKRRRLQTEVLEKASRARIDPALLRLPADMQADAHTASARLSAHLSTKADRAGHAPATASISTTGRSSVVLPGRVRRSEPKPHGNFRADARATGATAILTDFSATAPRLARASLLPGTVRRTS